MHRKREQAKWGGGGILTLTAIYVPNITISSTQKDDSTRVMDITHDWYQVDID